MARKTLLSVLSISILGALSQACSPQMLKFTSMSPRSYPYVGDTGSSVVMNEQIAPSSK